MKIAFQRVVRSASHIDAISIPCAKKKYEHEHEQALTEKYGVIIHEQHNYPDIESSSLIL